MCGLLLKIHFITDSVLLKISNVSNSNDIFNAVLVGTKACQVSDIYDFNYILYFILFMLNIFTQFKEFFLICP